MDKKLAGILTIRDRILKLLNGKMDDFFLGGGTALSLYYLKHRESFDLDFFTKDFSSERIKDVISNIETGLDVKAKIEEAISSEGKARITRCFVPTDDKEGLDDDDSSFKIDFIEDRFEYIETDKTTTGDIPVFSMENIYLRKIYAACGVIKEEDELGRPRFAGGRQAAKDLFGLYFLSDKFLRLSKFVEEYCPSNKERVVVWYRKYNRDEMKFGINEIIAMKEADFYDIERHFRHEVDIMIEKELI